MNCQTFEPTVDDLARGQMMEATLRESALAHAEDCERCGERLADERALSFSLRACASAFDTMGAPATLESNLRSAFRQRSADQKPAIAAALAPSRTERLMPWAIAAAAAVVTVFAMQAFRLRETPATPLNRASDTIIMSPMTAVAFTLGLTTVAVAPPKVGRGTPAQPRSTVAARDDMMLAGYPTARSRNPRPASGPKTTEAAPEIVTDFMPLTYGAALSPNEGGQLVRVELPRSALASMGLPVNVERANERVKADVLLGHDGLARAIRFVR
jgi:hypothetical protein